MEKTNFKATLKVSQSAEEVFSAVINPRGWWSEEIQGNTGKAGDLFDYHFEDFHRCQIRITESIPNKKVVWSVLDNYFKPGIFTGEAHDSPGQHRPSEVPVEWTGTSMVFEIAQKDNETELHFTHVGLVPEYECFEVCSNAWNHYIGASLAELITTGKGQPNRTGVPKTGDEEKFHAAKGN